MKRFALYGLTGAINTAVTFALYVLLVRHIDYRFAIVVVYPVGIALSYLLNGEFVFRQKGKLLRFIVLYVLLLSFNLVLTWLFVEIAGLEKVVAQLPSILCVYVVGYFLNRRFVFESGIAHRSGDTRQC